MQFNGSVLKSAFKQVYGSGWAFGEADANDVLNTSVGFDWDTWQAGNETAAALVDAPRGLQTMLDKRGIVLKGIEDTNIERIGSSLAMSLSEGLGAEDTANAIDYVIDDPARAMVIARTETTRALVESNLSTYEEGGITEVMWVVADPINCVCVDLDGMTAPIGEEFADGITQPPAHPNCVCTLSPVSKYDTEVTPMDDYYSDREPIDLAVSPDVVKYDENQERDSSGRFGSGSSGGSKLDNVADKIVEKTKALGMQGASFVPLNQEEAVAETEKLVELADSLINDPGMEMSAEDSISMNDGFNMTKAALEFSDYIDTDIVPESQYKTVSLHDSAGQIAGAAAMSMNVNDNGELTVELNYLGTTGIVDGAGSALFGEAIKFAESNGIGLQLHPLDSEATNFWEKMGFSYASEDSEWLSMSDVDVAAIADKIK